MNELALFAGAGGGILGGQILGWRTVCAVERDAYCAAVLAQRQNDGALPVFPIWSDIETFDGRPWRGIVDVVSGGFPCQDISVAGRGAGIDGNRSGLWSQMARVISEVRPVYALVENSPMLIRRGITRVLSDFAAMGFDAKWGIVGADDAGAPHHRKRIWILAHSYKNAIDRGPGKISATPAQLRVQEWNEGGELGGAGSKPEVLADAIGKRLERESPTRAETRADNRPRHGRDSDWWKTEPAVGRVVNGMAHRMDRLKALGNGQVPRVVQFAWELLK